MKPPLTHRSRTPRQNGERGVTMVLVAVAMIAIIAMAALSIDVVTLYLAREEAQRTADAAALAAARIISISGITGDPTNSSGSWTKICGPDDTVNGLATRTARSVAGQNTIGSTVAATVNVTYSAGGATSADCSALPFNPGVNNPMVTVQITRPGMPTFFSRIWGNTGNSVSATATAEAFNPSNSANIGNGAGGTIIPVQPRCVKPWIIPNQDPLSPNTSCTGNACNQLVNLNTGDVVNKGISLNGGNAGGVIGEQFWLSPDCRHNGGNCRLRNARPLANYNPGNPFLEPPPSLQYLPGEAPGASAAVPSCAAGGIYEKAIAGCDQTTVYQCGASGTPNVVDLAENPGANNGDTMNGVKCLIHESDENDTSPGGSGQDTLDLTAYPFAIRAGALNPVLGGSAPTPMSSSNSIVSLPIYDQSVAIRPSGTTNVTIVGFLQVFINRADPNGNVNVTVLNVAGCSNGSGPNPVGAQPAVGSSPVPVRLITPP